jgi:hypothetical protein
MGLNVSLAGKPAPQKASVRHILLHYHLFKNAGTSVDAILQKSFGDTWAEQEFSSTSRAEQMAALSTTLLKDSRIAALSSHTLLFPIPQIEGFEFFPVIFVRQPLARLRSAYEFERTQDADTFGAILAKQVSFAEYLDQRLANPNDRSCRDFQTLRLALYIPPALGPERARALAAVDLLPFVGLVEQFDQSVNQLQAYLAPSFPNFEAFSIRKNVTSRHEDKQTVLDQMREELGLGLFNKVVEANRGDLALYDKVRLLFIARSREADEA